MSISLKSGQLGYLIYRLHLTCILKLPNSSISANKSDIIRIHPYQGKYHLFTCSGVVAGGRRGCPAFSQSESTERDRLFVVGITEVILFRQVACPSSVG